MPPKTRSGRGTTLEALRSTAAAPGRRDIGHVIPLPNEPLNLQPTEQALQNAARIPALDHLDEEEEEVPLATRAEVEEMRREMERWKRDTVRLTEELRRLQEEVPAEASHTANPRSAVRGKGQPEPSHHASRGLVFQEGQRGEISADSYPRGRGPPRD